MLNIVSTTDKLQAELQESRDTLAKLTAQDAKLDGNLKELRQAMDTKLQHQQSPSKQQPLLLNE
jgi:phage shock protein A